VGVRKGGVVTNAVRSLVRPATRCFHAISRAAASVSAGRMMVSRRASLDVPAPGGSRRRRLWSERLHSISLHQCLPGCRLDTFSACFRESSAKLQGMFRECSSNPPTDTLSFPMSRRHGPDGPLTVLGSGIIPHISDGHKPRALMRCRGACVRGAALREDMMSRP
jgi:hypothetical protein